MTVRMSGSLGASGWARHNGGVSPRASPLGTPWARDPGFAHPGGGWLHGRGVRQRVVELTARADAQLGEDMAQVPLDRAGADEELRADLGIRAPIAREAGDVRLLRR